MIRHISNGAILLHDEQGEPLFSYNSDQSFVPASILKIFTSLAALNLLGKDFQFKTEFYYRPNHELIIKGWGDPYLISEEIEVIVDELKKRGILEVEKISFDISLFDIESEIPGTSKSSNPYDALNGALVVNFNSLLLEKDEKGRLYSGEEVTPLTPLAKTKGRFIKRGKKDRINLTDDPEESLRYVGELFKIIMENKGIQIASSSFDQIVVPKDWIPIYIHKNNHGIYSALQAMLKFSNNFIANQIYLISGMKRYGSPATLLKSKTLFKEFSEQTLGKKSKLLIIDEASGISRKNRLTAAVMMEILELFRPYAELLEVKNDAVVKSGTLRGVYNYAGYIRADSGLYPFVIIMNQEKNRRDDVLNLLHRFSKIKTTQIAKTSR